VAGAARHALGLAESANGNATAGTVGERLHLLQLGLAAQGVAGTEQEFLRLTGTGLGTHGVAAASKSVLGLQRQTRAIVLGTLAADPRYLITQPGHRSWVVLGG
jgi:hypothetical protein